MSLDNVIEEGITTQISEEKAAWAMGKMVTGRIS